MLHSTTSPPNSYLLHITHTYTYTHIHHIHFYNWNNSLSVCVSANEWSTSSKARVGHPGYPGYGHRIIFQVNRSDRLTVWMRWIIQQYPKQTRAPIRKIILLQIPFPTIWTGTRVTTQCMYVCMYVCVCVMYVCEYICMYVCGCTHNVQFTHYKFTCTAILLSSHTYFMTHTYVVHSLTHSLTHSPPPTHWFTLPHSLTHSFTRLARHPIIPAPIHLLTSPRACTTLIPKRAQPRREYVSICVLWVRKWVSKYTIWEWVSGVWVSAWRMTECRMVCLYARVRTFVTNFLTFLPMPCTHSFTLVTHSPIPYHYY